ncbi:MAG: hypothetical protein IJ237_00675 [Oscillospiraceae bacterium]|nr:hypothetical protein [Oscillospiraceae bacterium]
MAEKEKLTRKEKRLRWKEAKRAKRQAEKDFYQYAPWFKRVWNLYLKNVAIGILVVAVLFSMVTSSIPMILESLGPLLFSYNEAIKDQPLDEAGMKKLYEISPLDEDGAARIDALPAIGEDETWTICVYFVASNLEDMHENDLSYVTSMMTREEKTEVSENSRQKRLDRLTRFNTELAENGLELPAFFYYPDRPVASSTVVTQDVIVSEREGCASADIGEMTAEAWPDNIRVVIQTGGATHWSNQLVNPNRTQRFVYENGEMKEVQNLPLQNASSTDTLAGFLRFCRDEYHSDHNMLVLWNHGGGPFGYGMDSIYGGMFSLKDIRDALSQVYRPNAAKPAFDIIGFDACLMSTLEVTNALDGFADYYCLSEEVEPGDGWTYDEFIRMMAEDPTMSPAKVAQAVADSYTDHYIRQNINSPFMENNVTFSVIDAQKASDLYDAYADLCEKQLKDAADNIGVLAEINRCGSRATRYGGEAYNVFNTVDLGNYMDNLVDSYPEESSRIKDLIGETVLYHRQNGALSDSTGIAVYLPTEVRDISGLLYYLEYIYDVSEEDSVTALYYYKQAGCLSEEMKDQLATLTESLPAVFDVTPFQNFTKAEAEADEDGFAVPVDATLQNLISGYQMEIGLYDEENYVLTMYGRDNCLYLDGEGALRSDFDGKWIFLGDQPLSLEVVSSTGSYTLYRSHVMVNGTEAYLTLTYNNDTDEVTVTGVRKVADDGSVNYLINTRTVETLNKDDKIAPIYDVSDFSTNQTFMTEGKEVSYKSASDIAVKMLPEGYYLCTAVISDQRGDSYYSEVAGVNLDKQGISSWVIDSRFFGRDYY